MLQEALLQHHLRRSRSWWKSVWGARRYETNWRAYTLVAAITVLVIAGFARRSSSSSPNNVAGGWDVPSSHAAEVPSAAEDDDRDIEPAGLGVVERMRGREAGTRWPSVQRYFRLHTSCLDPMLNRRGGKRGGRNRRSHVHVPLFFVFKMLLDGYV